MTRPTDTSGGPPLLRLRSVPEALVRALTDLTSVSAERRAIVLRDIQQGSQPTVVYYVLLGLSELIAGFALIIGSDATLIGANVVAPLMTPIFGVSLGLMRSDVPLLRTALRAEFGGALVGVLLTYALGLMPFALEPTAELLAQTRPTLIDLMVATLAGLAGGLAMIDERVSPALPGVAIATALNPPIAAIGLCLALGAYQGAWGAFLLFFANVLAILAVAAVLFVVAGFVTWAEIGSLRGLARRFSVAAIGLVVVTVLLTRHLVTVVQDLRTERTIVAVLDQSLAQEPNTALTDVAFSHGTDGIDVLSSVSTPRVLTPERVKRIQDALAERLGEPVRLFLRCDVTKDVSATGATNLRPYLSLNGEVTEALGAPEMRILQQAEQVVREIVTTRTGISLQGVDLVRMPSGPVLIVTIDGPRTPIPANLAQAERMVRERVGEPDLRIVVRASTTVDMTPKGRILFGEAHFAADSADEAEARAAVERSVRTGVEALPSLFVIAVDAAVGHAGWLVRAEVVGPRVPTPAEVRAIEAAAAKEAGRAVAITLRSRSEILVTSTKYEPMGAPRPAEPAEVQLPDVGHE